MNRLESDMPGSGLVPPLGKAIIHLFATTILIAVACRLPAGAEKGFQLLSRSLMQRPARCAALYDGHVILGTGGGIAIYRSDGVFRRESFIPLGGEPYDITVRGNRAYIAAFEGGLRIVDISDPAHPAETGHYETRAAKHCMVSGDRVILGDGRSGVFILDIRSPDKPELVEIIKPAAQLASVACDADVLVIAAAKTARVYTLKGPGLGPILESEHELPVKIKKCFLAGGMLHLLTDEGTLYRTDLDDPAGRVELESLPVTGAINFCAEDGLGLALTEKGEIVPFDASGAGECRLEGPRAGIELGKPLKVSSVPAEGERSRLEKLTGKSSETVKGTSIFMAGDRIAVVGGADGMSVYALAKGGARKLGGDNPQGFSFDVVVRDGTLYLANGQNGVIIGSVGRDGSIEWIGHIQTDEARDVVLDGDVLVVADGRHGLKLYDVSDPRHPTLLGGLSSPYFHHAVEVHEGKAYIAGGIGGVEVIDISDARHPALIWRQDHSEVRGIHADGRFLYVADGYEGFRIYSLEERVPTLLSRLNTPGWNCDCFIIGDTAYLADGGNGIRTVDVSDRSKPRDLGSVDLKTLTREIHVLPGTVFAAAHTTGVAAIDVSDPERPFIVDRYDTVDDARGVFADGRFVYVASGSGGLYILRYTK